MAQMMLRASKDVKMRVLLKDNRVQSTTDKGMTGKVVAAQGTRESYLIWVPDQHRADLNRNVIALGRGPGVDHLWVKLGVENVLHCIYHAVLEALVRDSHTLELPLARIFIHLQHKPAPAVIIGVDAGALGRTSRRSARQC